MANPETSSRKDAPSSINAESESRARRRRRGYRGYPNNPRAGGDIHWGSGFSGIGAMNGPPGSSGILTERTREDASRGSSDEDDTLDQ
ncbi:MAG TPA: hypothetical protein VGH97_07865 [Thermoanaerobaculia bacterium]|jgi:hypothetical protein